MIGSLIPKHIGFVLICAKKEKKENIVADEDMISKAKRKRSRIWIRIGFLTIVVSNPYIYKI